jgi:hypothetical protein
MEYIVKLYFIIMKLMIKTWFNGLQFIPLSLFFEIIQEFHLFILMRRSWKKFHENYKGDFNKELDIKTDFGDSTVEYDIKTDFPICSGY